MKQGGRDDWGYSDCPGNRRLVLTGELKKSRVREVLSDCVMFDLGVVKDSKASSPSHTQWELRRGEMTKPSLACVRMLTVWVENVYQSFLSH